MCRRRHGNRSVVHHRRVVDNSSVPGKKLLPRLAVGCLLFAAIMGFGTYLIAKAMTPWLEKRNADYLKTHSAPK